MSPIIPSTSTKLVLGKASGSKPKSKKMIANRGPTTTGELKVQQMLKGTFVNCSDTMIHSALLPFKKVYFTCGPCYLVGHEKQYSAITYTQSHGQKCANRSTYIDWLSKRTELHHLIPHCIEIDEFERADATPQAKEDQSFSVSHLNDLQTSFNSKVSEMKEAADLLSEYTKKATETVPIKSVVNTAAPQTPPLPLPPAAAVAPTAVNPPTVKLDEIHPKRNRKPSAKALEAKQSI